MSRRSRGGGEEDSAGSWLNTYSDMVTLLLTFFIVMYSLSSVNEEKFQEVARAIRGDSPDSPQIVVMDSSNASSTNSNTGYLKSSTSANDLPDSMDALYDYINNYVKTNKRQADISVSKTGVGIVYIKFSNAMMFRPDDATLTREAQQTLGFLGKGLKNMEQKIQRIQVEGYTADTGDPNYPINDWKLSGERAASVVTYLNDGKGIEDSLFVSIGYGNTRPVATNSTEAGRIKNRRVEMKIYGTEANLKAADAVLAGTYDAKKYPTTEGGSTTTSSAEKKTASQKTTSKAASSATSAQSATSPYKD